MPEILPDLLRFDDGSAVAAQDWERRRQQLHDAILPHEYGGMPPTGMETRGILLCSSSIRSTPGITYRSIEVRTRFAAGEELSFVLNLWVPPGDGPFPVVIDGDGYWRYFDDAVVDSVLARGYAAASFNRTAVAADNKEIYRDTGLYRLFPDATFGALAAWAWAYHRCVDVLQELDVIASDRGVQGSWRQPTWLLRSVSGSTQGVRAAGTARAPRLGGQRGRSRTPARGL